MNLTKRQAIAKAKKIVEVLLLPSIIEMLDVTNLNEEHNWPDDYWISLSDNWDLNLWTNNIMFDLGVDKFATLYPVIDGNTDTRHFTNIEVEQ
jgi:hypothetical protein